MWGRSRDMPGKSAAVEKHIASRPAGFVYFTGQRRLAIVTRDEVFLGGVWALPQTPPYLLQPGG
jgi:hypothetical protein